MPLSEVGAASGARTAGYRPDARIDHCA